MKKRVSILLIAILFISFACSGVVYAKPLDTSKAEYFLIGTPISGEFTRSKTTAIYRMNVTEPDITLQAAFFGDKACRMYVVEKYDITVPVKEETDEDRDENIFISEQSYTLKSGEYFIVLEGKKGVKYTLSGCVSSGDIPTEDIWAKTDARTIEKPVVYSYDHSTNLKNIVSDVMDVNSISSAKEAACMPTYVYRNNEIEMLYNPYGASLAASLYTSAQQMKKPEDYRKWSKYYIDKGYEQIFGIIDSKLYSFAKDGTSHYITKTGNVFNKHLDAVLGIKKVSYNGKSRYNIALSIRGTQDIDDFFTDIGAAPIIDDGTRYHSGFYESAEQLYDLSREIVFDTDDGKISLRDVFAEMSKRNSKYTMFINGHSLGGAVAGIFTDTFLKEHANVDPTNFITYTFASPKTIYTNDSIFPGFCANIFNIVNEKDGIPKLPLNAKRAGYEIFSTPEASVSSNHYMSTYKDILKRINDKVNSCDTEAIMAMPYTTQYISDGHSIQYDEYCFLDCSKFLESEDMVDSDAYGLYIPLLDEVASSGTSWNNYYLVDIDGNGIVEMLLQRGMSESEFTYDIYTIQNGEVVLLGNVNGWHTAFAYSENKGYIYLIQGNYGVGSKYKLFLSNNAIKLEEVYRDQSLEKEQNAQYIPDYFVDDISPINMLMEG